MIQQYPTRLKLFRPVVVWMALWCPALVQTATRLSQDMPLVTIGRHVLILENPELVAHLAPVHLQWNRHPQDIAQQCHCNDAFEKWRLKESFHAILASHTLWLWKLVGVKEGHGSLRWAPKMVGGSENGEPERSGNQILLLPVAKWSIQKYHWLLVLSFCLSLSLSFSVSLSLSTTNIM